MKILLVEDDIFFQKFYSTKLKESGYEVDVASDGDQGLIKLMGDTKPSLVLLDLIMPNRDGFDVLSILSQNPQFKSLPIIVFSTLGNEQDMEKAKQLGAKDFIHKSFQDFEVLKQKIELYTKV